MSSFARLKRWVVADPVHAALTIGFGSAFLAYTVALVQRALDAAAPGYVLLAICMLGLAAVALSQRCARLLVWLSTNQLDRH